MFLPAFSLNTTFSFIAPSKSGKRADQLVPLVAGKLAGSEWEHLQTRSESNQSRRQWQCPPDERAACHSSQQHGQRLESSGIPESVTCSILCLGDAICYLTSYTGGWSTQNVSQL